LKSCGRFIRVSLSQLDYAKGQMEASFMLGLRPRGFKLTFSRRDVVGRSSSFGKQHQRFLIAGIVREDGLGMRPSVFEAAQAQKNRAQAKLNLIALRRYFMGLLEERIAAQPFALLMISQPEVAQRDSIRLLKAENVEELDFGFIVLFGFEEFLAAGEVALQLGGAGATGGD
jgi:hypothetical protein